MSTELEQRLREAFNEDAERARLVNPDGPPAPEARPLTGDLQPRWSPRRLVAVAAAVALIASATVAVTQSRDPKPEEQAPSGLEVFNDLRLGERELFTPIAAGESVPLPPAPISEREPGAVVWTGTELVVWGGLGADGVRLDDGAAFDPVTGTWRVLAPAPIGARDEPSSVWTGREMFVWGGLEGTGAGSQASDGAAYDPTTDSWRLLPESPIGGRQMPAVWTGEEVILVGGIEMVAYNPETNDWRELADVPSGVTGVISGGPTPLFIQYPDPDVVDYPSGDMGDFELKLTRYDVRRDRWQPVFDTVVSDETVNVTDEDGLTRAVLIVSRGGGVTVLDPAGEVLGTLPSLPGGRGAHLPMWAGEEVLFIGLTGSPLMALHPATETWKQHDAGYAPVVTQLTLAAEAGVLFGWMSREGETAFSGVMYRPPDPSVTTGTVDRAADPAGGQPALPAPGEQQPSDPAAAEEQVRAAFMGIFDTSRPFEERAVFSERPEVWRPAAEQLAASQYGAALEGLQAEVDGVVFTDPVHAAVLFRLVADSPEIPGGPFLGDAVLVDGRWLVAITTTCALVELANVRCDMARPPG